MNHFRYFLVAILFLVAAVSSCKKEESISVSAEILEVDYVGDDFSVTIQASSHWTVTPNYSTAWTDMVGPGWWTPGLGQTTDTGWISCSVSEGEAGTTRVDVHVEASTANSRYGSLVFRLTADEQKYLVVRVYQQGKLDRDMSDKLSPGMVQYLGKNIYYRDILSIKSLWLTDQPFDFSADLVYFENLEELRCNNSGLTAIDISMPKLRVLWLDGCKVRRLDPDLFPALEELFCSGNPLESLEILKAPKLKSAYCGNIRAEKELSLGPQLKYVSVTDCGLERLDLSQASGLMELDCSYNQLKEVDVSALKVSRLDCNNNPQLSSLKLSGDYLKVLYASSCNLSGSFTIDAKELMLASLQNNKLEKLSFTEVTSDCSILCDNNLLTEIELPRIKGNGSVGLTCTHNLLQGLRIADSEKFAWKGSDVTLNPGKDGIFTIYVSEEPDSYWVSYLIQDWQWEGQDVTVQFVIAPSTL